MGARDKREPGFWENLTPEQKIDEFNASSKDPHGYAAKNFQNPDATIEFKAPQEKPPQGDELPKRGRHKK
jgi:hypothetical protein